MIERPTVGMKCKLNANGMELIGGIKSVQMFHASQQMVITKVGDNLTSPEITYPLEVDQPLINRFMFTNWEVDAL